MNEPAAASPVLATLDPFAVARLPHIEFGPGRYARLPDAILERGHRALLVTGARSFERSGRRGALGAALDERGVAHEWLSIEGEPSPDVVDAAVDRFHRSAIEVVAGVGGGSVLDAAKAIAGLLIPGGSVRDHLEGVGPARPYRGPSTPFIAVPTTAGTGSEATKNAVLSEIGPDGFKRSFRDERLVAVEAIVDPDLLDGASPERIAANGADALTQLLESYVSARSNPLTDALARSGLEASRDGLLAWHADPAGPAAAAARSRMAYAALLSGICLAQTGLGVVHGLASPLGALFPIPHGFACGAALVAGVEANIRALETRQPDHPALRRYATIGRLLAGLPEEPSGPAPAGAAPAAGALEDAAARLGLVDTLRRWTSALGIPGLGAWGVGRSDVDRLVRGSRGSSMRTNPIELSDAEVAAVVTASL